MQKTDATRKENYKDLKPKTLSYAKTAQTTQEPSGLQFVQP